jgi:hypothetical protein
MTAKTSPAKKKASKKSSTAGKGQKAAPNAKGGWAETMKQALQNKRPASGFPDQPKPRDSGVQKVKKNAF